MWKSAIGQHGDTDVSVMVCLVLSGCGNGEEAEDVLHYESVDYMEYSNGCFTSQPLVEVLNDVIYYSDDGVQSRSAD